MKTFILILLLSIFSLGVKAQCAIEFNNDGLFMNQESKSLIHFSIKALDIVFKSPTEPTENCHVELIQLLNIGGESCCLVTFIYQEQETTIILYVNDTDKISVYVSSEIDEVGETVIQLYEFKRV